MTNYSYKYPLLNDKDWLHNKYVVDKLSTNQIALLAGAKTCNSARQALHRAGIPVRSISEGLIINNYGYGFILNEPVINGCLLGDGSLNKWNKENTFGTYFYKKNKYESHIRLVGDSIFGDKNYPIKSDRTKYTYKEKTELKTYYKISTGVQSELNQLYEKWYPKHKNFKKSIPLDLNLCNIALLHWFLDDGFSYILKDGRRTSIVFCTERYSEIEVEFLINLLYNNFGIKAYKRKLGSKHRIVLSQNPEQVYLFYDTIGKPPIPEMAYKWKIDNIKVLRKRYV